MSQVITGTQTTNYIENGYVVREEDAEDGILIANAQDFATLAGELEVPEYHIEYPIDKIVEVDLNNEEYSELFSFVKEYIDNEFDISNYMMDVFVYDYESNAGNITFTYKKENVLSTTSINIEVIDGKVVSASSSGLFGKIDDEVISTLNSAEEELMRSPVDTQSLIGSNISINSQKMLKRYDIADDKEYIEILTEYYDSDSDTYWMESQKL